MRQELDKYGSCLYSFPSFAGIVHLVLTLLNNICRFKEKTQQLLFFVFFII